MRPLAPVRARAAAGAAATLAVGLGLGGTVGIAPAAAAPAPYRFYAGAGSADTDPAARRHARRRTPPTRSSRPGSPTCPAAAFPSAGRFALQEPFDDLNGDDQWDAGTSI